MENGVAFVQRALIRMLILIVLTFFSGSLWSEEDWKGMMPEGDGKEVTVELCGTCHDLQKVVVSRKPPQEWERTVRDMVSRGAQIFPDEADQIIKYLSQHFNASK